MFVTRISRYKLYRVRYYPRFYVTAVGLGTYYPWIRRHYCSRTWASNPLESASDIEISNTGFWYQREASRCRSVLHQPVSNISSQVCLWSWGWLPLHFDFLSVIVYSIFPHTHKKKHTHTHTHTKCLPSALSISPHLGSWRENGFLLDCTWKLAKLCVRIKWNNSGRPIARNGWGLEEVWCGAGVEGVSGG
jgi:hypothetical protein